MFLFPFWILFGFILSEKVDLHLIIAKWVYLDRTNTVWKWETDVVVVTDKCFQFGAVYPGWMDAIQWVKFAARAANEYIIITL
jgi:hypothetical protein